MRTIRLWRDDLLRNQRYLNKNDANALLASPSNSAISSYVITLYAEIELYWKAGRVRDIDAGSGVRHVSNNATNSTFKFDCRSLEHGLSTTAAIFFDKSC
jgi:hypothetical protein